MDDTLRLLAAAGYHPRVVIDGGANVGQWATLASAVFPGAAFHLVEPQPECQARLRRLFGAPRYNVHPVALTSPGTDHVTLASVGGAGVGTGAYVFTGETPAEADVVTAAATTLDALFASHLALADRALLKLDLEGHELAALTGAGVMLPLIEVIVIEVTFYDIYNTGRKLFADVAQHLHAGGFVLYDVAAMYPRPRDRRLRMADVVFVRKDSELLADVSWD